MRAPLRQGDLDGLCGLYALVNAATYLSLKAGRPLGRNDRLELFQRMVLKLFHSMERRRIRRRDPESACPSIAFLWQGTSIKDLPPMLDELREFLSKRLGLMIWRSQPLLGNRRPESLEQFWSRLKECLDASEGRAVAIVGYGWRSNGVEEGHWTCVQSMTERVMLRLDSVGGKILRRSRVTIGQPTRRHPYRLAPHDVYLLTL
ncbi:MAG: hypothetical protein ACUVS3_07065 [Thermodesulfobacteriota bacterium]